jgi:hypothetical protein
LIIEGIVGRFNKNGSIKADIAVHAGPLTCLLNKEAECHRVSSEPDSASPGGSNEER